MSQCTNLDWCRRSRLRRKLLWCCQGRKPPCLSCCRNIRRYRDGRCHTPLHTYRLLDTPVRDWPHRLPRMPDIDRRRRNVERSCQNRTRRPRLPYNNRLRTQERCYIARHSLSRCTRWFRCILGTSHHLLHKRLGQYRQRIGPHCNTRHCRDDPRRIPSRMRLSRKLGQVSCHWPRRKPRTPQMLRNFAGPLRPGSSRLLNNNQSDRDGSSHNDWCRHRRCTTPKSRTRGRTRRRCRTLPDRRQQHIYHSGNSRRYTRG